jgi:hypothetical protein
MSNPHETIHAANGIIWDAVYEPSNEVTEIERAIAWLQRLGARTKRMALEVALELQGADDNSIEEELLEILTESCQGIQNSITQLVHDQLDTIQEAIQVLSGG